MDISLLKAGTLVVWVPFIQKTRIRVRHVDRDEFKTLMEECTSSEVVAGEIKENFDNALFNEKLCRKAVVDLEGFTEGETVMPFSPELLSLLIDKSSQFVVTVRGVCTDLDRLYTLAAEQTKKK